jgi:hypothetical protein
MALADGSRVWLGSYSSIEVVQSHVNLNWRLGLFEEMTPCLRQRTNTSMAMHTTLYVRNTLGSVLYIQTQTLVLPNSALQPAEDSRERVGSAYDSGPTVDGLYLILTSTPRRTVNK